jgi:structural maintenance of chromosome 2
LVSIDLPSLICSWKTSHDEVEATLKKERADLTRFDEELQDLDRVIKEKRQAVADAQLNIKGAEHSITTLQKERSAGLNAVAALEKGNPWIETEKLCVSQLAKHEEFCD